LASGVAVRTLQEFLAFFAWDHEQADQTLVRVLSARLHEMIYFWWYRQL